MNYGDISGSGWLMNSKKKQYSLLHSTFCVISHHHEIIGILVKVRTPGRI
jgi:hypothetical protein